jgi:hypothetical protein
MINTLNTDIDLATGDFISSFYGHCDVTFSQSDIFEVPTWRLQLGSNTRNSWGYHFSEKNPRITEVHVVLRRAVSRSDRSSVESIKTQVG